MPNNFDPDVREGLEALVDPSERPLMVQFRGDYPYEYFRYEVDRESNIATVTLANENPKKSNAAPWWCDQQLFELVDMWERDDDVKVVVVRGQGEDFSAGHDFDGYLGHFKINDKPDVKRRRPSNREQLLVERDLQGGWIRYLFSLKPVIAEVRGRCFDMGNHMQAFADISIAADDAHIGSLGQIAGAGGVDFLRVYMHLIGYKRAREMWTTGRTWSGRDAALIGLVNRAVPKEQLQEEVMTEARRIALLPIDGIVTSKAYTHMVLESMGIGKAATEMAYGHALALRMRFEENEYAFLKDVRAVGASKAFRNRIERYEPLGGLGERAERPIVP
jgi:enoyl-CoA hydratase